MTNHTSQPRRARILLGFTALAILFLSGCVAPPQPLSKNYTEGDYEISVDLKKIPKKGKFRGSGKTGLLVGGLVAMSRQGSLRKKMEGVTGATVQELLRQELSRGLEEHFYIEDESDQLRLEVIVTQWGWYLPTGVMGVKTGTYHFEIMGMARVYDKAVKNGKKAITSIELIAQEPIGDKPDPDRLEEIMLQTSEKFSAQITDFLLGINQ